MVYMQLGDLGALHRYVLMVVKHALQAPRCRQTEENMARGSCHDLAGLAALIFLK